MTYRKKETLWILLIMVVLCITGCGANQLSEEESSGYDTISAPQLVVEEKEVVSADKEELLISMFETTIPNAWQIDLPEVYQEPELPTGCESVTLTMILMYYGFDLEKTTIAEDYLIYSENGDFSEGFIGNPWSYDGAGCFPPTIIDTADAFLSEMGSELTPMNENTNPPAMLGRME